MKVVSPVTGVWSKKTITHLGPKKYWLFGERLVNHTETVPGRMVISNIVVDFEGQDPPTEKFNIRHEDKILLGVAAYSEIRPDIWECTVDSYNMVESGLDRTDRSDIDSCCGDPSCPSNN